MLARPIATEIKIDINPKFEIKLKIELVRVVEKKLMPSIELMVFKNVKSTS